MIKIIIQRAILFKTVGDVVKRFKNYGKLIASGGFVVSAPTICTSIENFPEEVSTLGCIKQACLLSVNSASALLTSTVSAIVDSTSIYKEDLSRLISLLTETELRNGLDEELWDSIIALRTTTTEHHAQFHRLLVFMENVEKVVEATIETVFNAEADFACKTLCERSHSAAEEIRRCKLEIEVLEQEYLQAQVRLASLKRKVEDEKEQKYENDNPS